MTKKRKISISVLALASAASLCAAAAITGGALAADAEREVTLNGGNFFYTANQAQVQDYETDNGDYYTSFTFADGDSAVTYRKNLAYHWYASVRDGENKPTATAQEGWLSTKIGFDAVTFETFTIKFQSQQYTQTDSEVTENYITFVANDEADGVYVKIGEALPADETEKAEALEEITSGTLLSPDEITISFTSYAKGSYSVEITDGENTAEGSFDNIGGSYVRYVSSSSDTSVIPVTYSAQFAENATSTATMVLYEFNDQSFKLEGTGSRHINDNVAPVVCLNEDITTLEYGRSLDLDYAVIDMLATSPRSTVNYYVLKNSQQQAGNLNNTGDDGYFKAIASGGISPIIKGSGAYLPEGVDADNDAYTTECLVKVYISVQDTSASNNNSDKVFLDWYVPSEYLCKVTSAGTDYNFIRATDDGEGAHYVGTTEAIQESYQSLVDQAITDQKATAGDDNFFYLPAFEDYVKDNITLYRDLSFSVYYISSSSGSSSSLDYNELAIELKDEGLYKFAIYATDVAGNSMYYIDENGEKVEFAASELTSLLSDPAESDLVDYVPVFQFEVSYEGLSVTAPDGQDIGFKGTEYSVSDFEVTGLSSQYNQTYSLYKFDRYAYYTENGNKTISYAQFLAQLDELFNGEATRKYFVEIIPIDDMEETDPEYKEFADYEWDDSALTFVPQDENAFYLVRMEAVDTTFQTKPIESLMGISVSAAADPVYGEDNWVEDNVAAIVLFCVAGVALIGIIVLAVIKPKDKGDIDVIAEKDAKRASKKTK